LHAVFHSVSTPDDRLKPRPATHFGSKLLSCISIQKYRTIFSLRSISLFQFKNYSSASFHFTERIIGICGQNGIGKTNLLDAIYSLCFTKSYFNRSDAQNVQHDKQGFRLEGNFDKNGQVLNVVSILRETGKKEFLADGQLYERLAQHIGLLPAVIIVPDDVLLISGGSEERRRFLDTLFSQLDHDYLQQLISYNRVLQQRNAYLKSLDPRKSANHELLDAFDRQLVHHGDDVFQKRRMYCSALTPLVNGFYERIAGKQEGVSLLYESQLLNKDMLSLLKESREKDIILQRTTAGIHKDDLVFSITTRPFKAEASQGQRKSLLFALKLAEFETLKMNKGFAPILLLDDLFEKLDEERIQNLLQWVCRDNGGQIFVTDTHAGRFTENINRLGIKYQLADISV
jgi:DNA replication and repair protein RecF